MHTTINFQVRREGIQDLTSAPDKTLRALRSTEFVIATSLTEQRNASGYNNQFQK